MGATLPVLCLRFVADPHDLGRSLGWLYAVNPLGAAAGSLLTGFVLMPGVGMSAAIRAGVAASWTVALIAWGASRTAFTRGGGAAAPGSAGARPADSPESGAGPGAVTAPAVATRRLLYGGYAVSGLAAMMFQIAWSRVLALVIGSSVYAFALLVSAFILGLALGSGAASRFADRLRRPALGFAVAELGIG